ncbi:hypothetical protein EJ03DRAFT_353664 [Teratosphaeria nubilosa]|uniref:Myb-like DNA-binding domain-containing protein n=1 Tax=Teratosphaeria nubilosa TaxID=161662 RepID=A0A6G1L1H0_9PEZI|nr:hypothetical protein EJ03DRAFT_353664 [Teratosphaeria nubilosa]
MAISNEQFLFCCIENSNNGTVNWTAVAEACGTTKGAASIKYRRMKEKFGTISEGDRDGSAGGDADGDASKTPKKKATPKKTPNKKRKVDEDEAKADDAEEDVVKGEDADE